MSACVLSHGSNPDGGETRAEAEGGLLCPPHRRRLDRTTTELRDLWYDLTFILEAGTAPKDETPKTRHLKSAEAPAPANLEALSLRDPRSSSVPLLTDQSTPIPAVLAIVASWLLLVAEERPLAATKLPQSVIAQLSLLELHHDWMSGQDWIADYVSELDDLRKALKLAVRDHSHRKVGRCQLPITDQEQPCHGTLMQENGSDVIRCVSCGAQWVTPREHAMLSISLESA